MRTFVDEVEKGLGAVVILAGSDSDLPHIKNVAKALDVYDIRYEVRIASAHKQPQKVIDLVKGYDSFGKPLAYIAVAGGTDALSGTVSFHSRRPVISCPPDAPNQTCLTNPPGSSNATIYNPKNAARFIAQMFSHLNPECYNRLEREKADKIEGLQAADEKLRREIEGGQQDGVK